MTTSSFVAAYTTNNELQPQVRYLIREKALNYQRFESELKFDNIDNSSISTIVFSGELTIQDAVTLKDVLSDAMSKSDICKLDLELVSLFDLASIQILFAAHKSAVAKNKKLELNGDCPNIFKKAVFNAGFDHVDWLCFRET